MSVFAAPSGNGQRRRRLNVLVVSDSAVLATGLVAILRQQGVAAAGRIGLDGVTPGNEPPLDVILVAPASPTTEDLQTMLGARRDGAAMLLLLPDSAVRIHAKAVQRAGAACVSLTSPPSDIADHVRRAAASRAGTTAVAEEVVRGVGGTLTPREAEILELVAKGMTNGLIAAELRLSPETVKSHLTRIFRKLGVLNRAEALTVYLEAT